MPVILTTFLISRHAQSTQNAGVAPTPSGLTDHGTQEAHALGHHWDAETGGHRLDKAFSSTKARAISTLSIAVEHVGLHQGVAVQHAHNLDERDWAAEQEWEVQDRAEQVVDGWRDLSFQNAMRARDAGVVRNFYVGVVTHGNFLQSVLQKLEQDATVNEADIDVNILPPNASTTKIVYAVDTDDGATGMTIDYVNRIDYLQGGCANQ